MIHVFYNCSDTNLHIFCHQSEAHIRSYIHICMSPVYSHMYADSHDSESRTHHILKSGYITLFTVTRAQT